MHKVQLTIRDNANGLCCVRYIVLGFVLVSQLVMKGQYVRWECFEANYNNLSATCVRKFFVRSIQYNDLLSLDMVYTVWFQMSRVH